MQNFKRLLMLFLLAALLVSFSGGDLLAHEIILNFPAQVEAGEEVEIEFTYGHYPDNFDYQHSHFAALAEQGELLIFAADGSKEELDFNKEQDRYVSNFTPSEEGVFWVVFSSIRNVVDRSDEDGGKQLRYYDAKAPLMVGEQSGRIVIPDTSLQVELVNEEGVHSHVDDAISLQVSYQGQEVSGQSVTILDPLGQAQELVSDQNGIIEFTPQTEGEWLLHIGYLTDLERAGSYAGAEYDRTRYNSALYLEVGAKRGFLQRLFN